ncbi:RNI-like protein [Ceratocystis lukuohia]|uniref:RNI-like protein n=1 Tax=Ceratocystis lukuohia TaxID=2019550 RepID=A0ABR4MN41_9PEZI
MFSFKNTIESKPSSEGLTKVSSTPSSIESTSNSTTSHNFSHTISLSRRLLRKLGYKRFTSKPLPTPHTGNSSYSSANCSLASDVVAGWSSLPLELQIEVMSYLSLEDRVRFRQVSRASKLIVEASPITTITATKPVSLLGDVVIASIIERHASFVKVANLEWTSYCGPQMARVIFSKCHHLRYIHLGPRSHVLFEGTELPLDVIHEWLGANKHTLQAFSYPSLSRSTPVQLPVLGSLASSSSTNLESLEVPILPWDNGAVEPMPLVNTIEDTAQIIQSSPQLRRLVLADNKSNNNIGVIAEAIYNCSSLQVLELRHCLLTCDNFDTMLGTSQNSDFPDRAPLRKWKKLSLSCGPSSVIDDACLRHLIGRVPELQYLKLDQTQVKTSTLNSLLATTPHLRFLSISPSSPSAGQAGAILQDDKLKLPPRLIHLSLHGSKYHSPQMMSHILQQSTMLENIDLSCSNTVSDNDIANLVSFAAQQPHLMAQPQPEIASHMRPSFITISVTDCPRVTWQSVVKCIDHNQDVFRQRLECAGHAKHSHHLCNHPPLIRLLGHYEWRVKFESHFAFCLIQNCGYKRLEEMAADFKGSLASG